VCSGSIRFLGTGLALLQGKPFPNHTPEAAERIDFWRQPIMA
jgi:hypothetical protein